MSRRKVSRTAAAYLVMGFVVMQVVDAVFPYVPGVQADLAGTLVFLLLALGFPLALGLAWALEVTPQGVRKEVTAEAATALGGSTVLPVQPLRRDSVAVLPLENLSADPDNEYFSDGITDDIIASVARISGLRVLSRASVMRYKNVRKRASEIAGELGVATIIGGSVRRIGSKIRAVVQVVDGQSDDLLRSETYDRELEDIFRVQSEVAAAVALAVQMELTQANLTGIGARGTRDAEAYDLYLRGRFHWGQRGESAVAASVACFDRALERDPRFALAHAGLADAYTILGIYGARAPSEVMEAAKRSSMKALEVDPTLGEAQASLACVRAAFDWKWDEAEVAFQRAIELAPSYATAHQWYAMNLLAPMGRFAEASVELDRAEDLDPRSAAIATSRGILAFYARDYAGAFHAEEAVLAQHPRFALAHYFVGLCQEAMGRPSQALEPLRRAVEMSDESSETLAALGHALAAAGHVAEAEAVSQRLEARAAMRYVSPTLLAQVRLGLGDRAGALDRLTQAADVRATDLVWLGVRPVYDPLRGEPGFEDLIRRVGLDRAR